MKAASAGLISLLQSGARNFFTHRCVEIATADGGYTLRYTTADVSVSFPGAPAGAVFRHNGVQLDMGATGQRLGLEVDESEMSLFPIDNGLDILDPGISPALPAGVTLKRAVDNGLIDRARITIWRFFSPHPAPDFGDLLVVDPQTGNPAARAYLHIATGAIKWFTGYVTSIEEATAREIPVKFKSALDLLNQPYPRYVYRHDCVWDLYSAGCGVQRALYAHAGITNTSTRLVIHSAGRLPAPINGRFIDQEPDGYFNEGVITFTSGPNAFVKRGVKEHRGGVLNLTRPLPYDPEVGDLFDVVPGCNKARSTCIGTFNNEDRYRGMPHTPGPDATQGARLRDVTDLPIGEQDE